MNRRREFEQIEKMLRQAGTSPLLQLDPVVLERIVSQGLEEFDRQQRQKQTRPHRSRIGWDIRLFFPQIALAAIFVVATLVWIFFPSKPVQANSEIFKSIDGLSHAEIRAIFPNFAGLQEAPDELPVGSAAQPGDVGSSQWPSFEGFDVLADSKLFDMTWWQPLDPGKIESGRISPVVMTRALKLRRNSSVPRVKELRIKFSTSGFAVDPVKLKSTDRVLAVPETELSYKNGRPERVFFLVTDVSDEPDNAVFTLVIHAVFWNGFNHDSVEDASTALATAGRGFAADLGVLLPRNHSIKSWALYKIPLVNGKFGDKLPDNCFEGGQPPRDERGILYWPIADPQPSYRYTMDWSWAVEGTKQ